MSAPASKEGTQQPSPKLRLTASADELVALRAALVRLFQEPEDRFSRLFAPGSKDRRVEPLPPETSWPLLHFGLAERDADGKTLIGRHRVRCVGDRFYVMELGGLVEYFQDVWPETDALLAVLDGAKTGRLLDLGTGTGIIAIEAARRGQTVVATDLYATAIALAEFNARLNGVAQAIDFRVGHQLEPVRDERFDLILTAPHYTRVADQLRLEVLRAGPGHLTPSGRLVVATMMEWQSGPPPVVEEILRPQAESGLTVQVEPLPTPYKREWFTVRRLSADLVQTEAGAQLVSRHRFLITVTAPPVEGPGRGSLSVRPPTAVEQMIQPYVPLHRLRQSLRSRPDGPGVMPTAAVVHCEDDVTALRELLVGLESGVVSLGRGAVPFLHDACRYGARRCVTAQGFDGAAGAILSLGGQVRPCSFGQPIGLVTDTTAQLVGKLQDAAGQARARRGCATCPVEAHCSQCLFPFPLDELRYCALLRSVPKALPLLPRLSQALLRLAVWSQVLPLAVELRLKVRPSTELVAAQGRPLPQHQSAPSANDLKLAQNLMQLREAWQRYDTWLAALGTGHFALLLRAGQDLPLVPIPPLCAVLGELIGDGCDADEIRQYLRLYAIPPAAADQALETLYRLFQLTPT